MKKINTLILIGMTCCGKSTVINEIYNLASDFDIEFDKVVPYTTRPRRDGEADGIDYHYVSDKRLEEKKENDELLTYEKFNTKYGIWKYALAKDSFVSDNIIPIKHKIHISNAKELEKIILFGKINPVTFYLDVNDKILLDRMEKDTQRGYAESKRRFEEDYDDYIRIRNTVANFSIECTHLTPKEIAFEILKKYKLHLQGGDILEVIPEKHLKEVCKVGQGNACCRYIVADSTGITCAKNNPSLKKTLDHRVASNQMIAMADNCIGL